MIIGFDAKRLFANESGLGSYARTLVEWLSIFYPHCELRLYTPLITREDRINHYAKKKGLQIQTGWKFMGWLWRSFWVPLVLKQDHVDVYHGLSGELPFTLLSGKIKKVVTIHDVMFRSRPQDYNWFDRLVYDLKTRWSLRIADEVICVSNYTRSQLLKYYRPDMAKVKVINPSTSPVHTGYESHLKASEFKSLYNVKSPYFLYVGNVRGRKNLSILIRALQLLSEDKRKKLIIISNDKVEMFSTMYGDDDIIDWIRIETNVPDRILAEYYQYASAVICSSREEGFGLSVTEALNHGAVTICSDTDAHREAGGDAVYYFQPDDAEGLAEILSNLSYRERKTKDQTLSHLNKFDPGATTKQLMDVYRQD